MLAVCRNSFFFFSILMKQFHSTKEGKCSNGEVIKDTSVKLLLHYTFTWL